MSNECLDQKLINHDVHRINLVVNNACYVAWSNLLKDTHSIPSDLLETLICSFTSKQKKDSK